MLYIPGILTSYPSANSIRTQHVVGKGKTNTKEPLTGNLNLTENFFFIDFQETKLLEMRRHGLKKKKRERNNKYM